MLYDIIAAGIGGAILAVIVIVSNRLKERRKKKKEERTAIKEAEANVDIVTKSAKIRYCKMCGSEIDSTTKVCTGCGKKYFKLPKNIFLITATIILTIAVIVLSWIVYREKQTTLSYKEQLEEIEQSQENLLDKYTLTLSDATKYKIELGYYHEQSGLITDSGKKYHNYGCSHTHGKNVYLWDIWNLEKEGYEPCKDCH